MSTCPFCAEEIEAAAAVCPHCESALTASATVPAVVTAMPVDEQGRGPTRPRFKPQPAGIVACELVLMAGAFGWLKHSWVASGGVLLGLVTIQITHLDLVLAILLSAGWGGIGYLAAALLSDAAAYVIGALAFAAALAAHVAAIDWKRNPT